VLHRISSADVSYAICFLLYPCVFVFCFIFVVAVVVCLCWHLALLGERSVPWCSEQLSSSRVSKRSDTRRQRLRGGCVCVGSVTVTAPIRRQQRLWQAAALLCVYLLVLSFFLFFHLYQSIPTKRRRKKSHICMWRCLHATQWRDTSRGGRGRERSTEQKENQIVVSLALVRGSPLRC
jgi:hypothetical protein